MTVWGDQIPQQPQCQPGWSSPMTPVPMSPEESLQYILQLRQRRKKKRGVREDIEMREKKSSIVAHDLKVAPIAKGHEQLRGRMDRDATYIFLKMA